jgi:hypothetical protein
MNENDNFESLRQLLSLKRHEVPPPGYFNRFPDRVIARIRAGEREVETATPWYLRFMQIFEAKPAFASSFASVLCLLLLFGIVYAEQSDQTPQALMQNSQLSLNNMLVSSSGGSSISVTQPPAQNDLSMLTESISNSSPTSLQPMFGGQNVFAQQASFNFSGQ